MKSAAARFRVMAYVVGVGLLVLVLVAMPLKYGAHQPAMVAIIGPIHGFLFAVYLLFAFDLSLKCRWPISKTLLVLLAGTIPFLSFVMERRITREVRQQITAESLGSHPA